MVLVMVWYNKNALLARRVAEDLQQPHPYSIPAPPFVIYLHMKVSQDPVVREVALATDVGVYQKDDVQKYDVK